MKNRKNPLGQAELAKFSRTVITPRQVLDSHVRDRQRSRFALVPVSGSVLMAVRWLSKHARRGYPQLEQWQADALAVKQLLQPLMNGGAK